MLVGLGTFVFGVYLTVSGGLDLVRALGQREPRAVTVAQLRAERPTSGWVRVTDGTLNLSLLIYIKKSPERESLARVYIPLVSAGGPADRELVVETSDPTVLAQAEEFNAADASDEAWNAYMKTHRAVVFQKRPVEGMLRDGYFPADRNIPTKGKVPDSPVVILEGRRPATTHGTRLLFAGIVALLLGGKLFSNVVPRRGLG